MWDAVSGGLQPQPWHHSTFGLHLTPIFQDLAPTCTGITVHPYVHPQHIMALKYFIYVQIYVTWPILFSDTYYSSGEEIVQVQSQVKPSQSLVQSLIRKKRWLWGVSRQGSVHFFQPIFTGIILRAIWVDLATQKWSRGDLKKWHFYLWTPYLSAPHAQSCAGGYFFLGSTSRDGSPFQINCAIHITCTFFQTGGGLCGWSGAWRTLSQCTRGQSHPACPRRTRSSTTTNSHIHWQHHYCWHC